MVDHLIGCEQVIRYDPSVTAPPDRLGAHDDGMAFGAKFAQAGEADPEVVGESVVGVVPEAIVLPEPILRCIRGALLLVN